jgi:hypothetical protein
MSETNGSTRPLAVFSIPEEKEDGEKVFWTQIGVAFTNRDGSITIILNALPCNTNRLQIREKRPPAEPRAPGARRNGFETVEVHP